ncbi:hypothetical protein EMIT047CA2_130035 [Pseudomonas soli]|jgi:hypothetical protein
MVSGHRIQLHVDFLLIFSGHLYTPAEKVQQLKPRLSPGHTKK